MLTYKVQSYEFAAETQACRKLLTILGSVDMCIEPAQPMDLHLMSVPMIEQLVLNCEELQQQQQGIVLCNVRLLHKILMSECQSLPAAMSGQRSLVLEVPLHDTFHCRITFLLHYSGSLCPIYRDKRSFRILASSPDKNIRPYFRGPLWSGKNLLHFFMDFSIFY